MSGNRPLQDPPRTAVKTYGTTPAFASAKTRATLSATDVRSAEAARKINRVCGATTARSTRISTFNSAL
ncbi:MULTISPECIES: FxSxx-COOH cyclophane-containing RiPP peptide [Streptomyces]|uniref:FxSxx-COOH cyclophane-containing RiPP peptide n=1 Tax=Streptomyces TaxID=1883 RepID=UPI001471D82A|nr:MULTISPECIES: FxSxx-COOH cyclophane-containing RiPP peptide [Streptomyces]MCX4483694.1 FxSxx-COOH protein [Streptomyces anulatus]MCX4506825.1 FxSxx-COOH protein [Streptomyces anulatus]MCX4517351.1 FxSxx-COOH protein [Streptomyces anulatus]MCX4600182.1 FxSxx-COOH protein [Streptomyces anulatus]WSC60517.1 FxSxx-COOH protein [Streptomyces anulatus]